MGTIDFYMGTLVTGDAADLRPVYRWIFVRLRDAGWREQSARAEETSALAGSLERAFEDDVARARHAPLPAIVAAYRDCCGGLPKGWPHPDM